MANASVGGLKPTKYLSGSPYMGAVNVYAIAAGDSTATFIGDLVKLAGTAETVNDAIYTDVIQAATGDKIVGAVVGFVSDTRDSLLYRAASTLRLVLVADDPNLVFEAQDMATGTPIPTNDIGLNVNFVVGSGSTTTGISAFELNNATQNTTNTLDLKIIGAVNRPDNTMASANAKFLVRINRHEYANQVAGV